MKRFLLLCLTLSLAAAAQADPLRVFIRGGKKSHGPNQHDHERFLNDWKVLLAERGITVDGGMDWPTEEQIKNTDVIVAYAQEGGNCTPEQETLIENFTRRGGGIVVIHTAAVSQTNPPWWKSIIGGSWVPGKTKWHEGMINIYYQDKEHPITREASNFYINDEIYYDMDISPDVHVLATTYTSSVPEGKSRPEGGKPHVYDIQPQIWTYEKTAKDGTQPYRAFVGIPGHMYFTFEKPFYRAILMRAIAWTGKRADTDEFCKPDELASLRYPEGGPSKPADELAKLEVHPDFTMKLVASEPLISKPINFNWDADGRLWVAETPEYPNGRRGMRPDYRGREWKDHGGLFPEPGQQKRDGQDKISILSDSDGDGVMDKKSVFAEGLDLVTGFVFYKDGVIATQAPDVLFLRDTDGDGKADKVEKLYTNLGTSDTHAVINNPRMGWDGWIYATHGYSASDDVRSGDDKKHFGRIGAGVVRFKPDGSVFEQYTSSGCNTWGLTITADNRVMWTQPTCGHLLMQTILPESTLARGRFGGTRSDYTILMSPKAFPTLNSDEMPYVQIDQVGSFTAASGCEIYDGGSWPAEYNGDFFTTEPTINLIHHEKLTLNGGRYSAKKQAGREELEFVRAKDLWFRPIEVRIGPDGALYVADFYNQAVIHNDTRGPDHNLANAAIRPDRDHYFGRIWKLDHKDAKKLEVPKLAKAPVVELVKALEHPNRHVRMTARRLISDLPPPQRGDPASGDELAAHVEASKKSFGYESILSLVLDAKKPVETRIAALWTAAEMIYAGSKLEWLPALKDKDPAVRRSAALQIPPHDFSAVRFQNGQTSKHQGNQILDQVGPGILADDDGSVRIAVLCSLTKAGLNDDFARALIAVWPKLDDDFQKSAAVAAATRNPSACIVASLDSKDSGQLAPLIQPLIQAIADRNDAEGAAKIVIAFSAKPESAELQRAVLATFSRSVSNAPKMTPELKEALTKLLAGPNAKSTLGIAAKWDKEGALKAEIAGITKNLLGQLGDANAADDARISSARNLLNVRSTNPEVLPAVVEVVGGNASVPLKKQIVEELARTGDASIGDTLVSAYNKLPGEVQAVALETLLQRADWSLALVKALQAKQLDIAFLKPADTFRLRTHPDKEVAKQASAALDALQGAQQAKSELLIKLTPEVEKPGDVAKGKALFTTTCAICHKLDDLGAEVGPALTGMGAHGPGELLIHVIDPNREVDPSFATWNIETKDGQFHVGAIARENSGSIMMKSLAGQVEIKQADIKSRVNTGRSLMPEGFEGLGAEALRDILAFMCSGKDAKFRTVELRDVFTADSRFGLFRSREPGQGIPLKRFGTIKVGEIPFVVVDAAKSGNGKNLLVLKGGTDDAQSKKQPQKVEIRLGNFKANRLHFLGGITGWGYKGTGEVADAMKITVVYSDQQTEEIQCKSGVEFVDFLSQAEVPGSKLIGDLAQDRQIRWFTKQLARTAPIEKIILESPNTVITPVTLAITAELAE